MGRQRLQLTITTALGVDGAAWDELTAGAADERAGRIDTT